MKDIVTFKESENIPYQRWYPFLEGFSPGFLKEYLKDIQYKSIYDPFCGTGTSILSNLNHKVYYSEINPVLKFISETKFKILKIKWKDNKKFSQILNELVEITNKNYLERYILSEEEDVLLSNNYSLISSNKNKEIFPRAELSTILKVKSFINNLRGKNELVADLVTIAAIKALVPSSYYKRAGDLRRKKVQELEREFVPFLDGLYQALLLIKEDLEIPLEEVLTNSYYYDKESILDLKFDVEFVGSNAKNIEKLPYLDIDIIFTSPPYSNGTNYFRNTKLELWFLGNINEYISLRDYRNEVVTSGINDVGKINYLSVSDKSLTLNKSLIELSEKMLNEKKDKRIAIMIDKYFSDMYQIFFKLNKHLNSKSKIFIDIGDSFFYDIYIPTADILIELFSTIGYSLDNRKTLRERKSRNGKQLKQEILVFSFNKFNRKYILLESSIFEKNKNVLLNWNNFKKSIPYKNGEYKKKNWGHPLHSLCSYYGKLKPSIAYHLIKTFTSKGDSVLDPFSGVGTIPFEAALNGIKSFAIDISPIGYANTLAKVQIPDRNICMSIITELESFIKENKKSNFSCTLTNKNTNFGFNGKLIEYFHPETFEEIVLAREFFKLKKIDNASIALVFSSLLHILHGNRPYALSRRSHPITPFKPSGPFEYKNLIEKLINKVERSLNVSYPSCFTPGKVYKSDSLNLWPYEINNLNAIITSPPFFDSTRFYTANWLRIWFAGWEKEDFKTKIYNYLEEKQKKTMSVYKDFFQQSRERLKVGGFLVMHLGKSKKKDMAKELIEMGKDYFTHFDLHLENVENLDKHGISDKGTVTQHQFLIFY